MVPAHGLLTAIGAMHCSATPRPPRGPGDDDGDELPIGDPAAADATDDPSDEDEGEEDDEPLHGAPAVRADQAGFAPRGLRCREPSRTRIGSRNPRERASE